VKNRRLRRYGFKCCGHRRRAWRDGEGRDGR
jgi:hypothetical protein